MTTNNVPITDEIRHKNALVIINADDFGITKGVNESIIELANNGVVTSTTVMTNMPYYNQIDKLTHKIGVGIHLNLTTGKPIRNANGIQSIVNDDGFFMPLSSLIDKMYKHEINGAEVYSELDAQIHKLIELNIEIDHIDSHESILKYPFFIKIIKRLGLKYQIPAVRTYTPLEFDLLRLLSPKKTLKSLCLAWQKSNWEKDGFIVTDRYDSLLKKDLRYNEAIEKIRTMFSKLPQGILEVGVHPGYCDNDNHSLGTYVKEREVELKALNSTECKDMITGFGMTLISYTDILRKV